MLKRNTTWAVAKTEYIKWITNPRMILFAVLLMFLYQSAVEPLLGMAEQMQGPLHWLEPFLAVANAPLLMLVIPLTFLTLLADFPRIDGNALFFLHRTGRQRWLRGQLLFALLAAASFLALLFLGVTLPAVGHLAWTWDWSATVRYYARTYPEQAQSFAARLIQERLFNQTRPWPAMLHTCLLQTLYLLLLALLLLWFWCRRAKKAGLFCAALLVCIGAALALLDGRAMWLLPMAHANVWLRYTPLLRQPIMPMWVSYLVLAALALLLGWIDRRAIARYDFFDVFETE